MSKGILICVMGVDGSGKSTAAHAAVDLLKQQGVDATYVWNRWEPRLVSAFTGKAYQPYHPEAPESSGPNDPYARKRRLLAAGWRRWLWLRAASVDYALTGSGRARRAIRRHAVVICDRYTPDFIVDQAMNIGGAETSIEEVRSLRLMRAFPQPVGYVLLDLEPAIALARKDDGLTPRAAAEKVDLYRTLARSMGAMVIDASPDSETVSRTLADVVCALIQRARK